MVALLQVVLQLYAGQALLVESEDRTEAALNDVLLSSEVTWGLQVGCPPARLPAAHLGPGRLQATWLPSWGGGPPRCVWPLQVKQLEDEVNLPGSALLEAVQRRMETIALRLPAGSLAQRVQARPAAAWGSTSARTLTNPIWTLLCLGSAERAGAGAAVLHGTKA